MAALCEELSREQILQAIRERRVYALTGDRIEVEFSVDGSTMGSTIDAGGTVEVAYSVRGRDELDMVEVVQDGRTVHRSYPAPTADAADSPIGVLQLRLEGGWGPWGALALDRITDWAFDVQLDGARLKRYFPCLQSMPFDESRRHRFERDGEQRLSVVSYSARHNAYRENPNQSVVLEIEGDAAATLTVDMRAPEAARTTATLAQLFDGSLHRFTGPFPNEAWQWHRVVPLAASSLSDRVVLPVPATRSHVYLRVRQKNGHMAWVSPVFVNHR
jgi:hypothetical protein